MSKRWIKAGSVDQTIDVFILDSSSTIGAGLSGLVFNSAGLACYYRKGATGSATALTLATQTVGGAHSDGGFVEISATNMKGVYRLDLSDTIVATAGMVTVYLYGATNMAPVVLELEVVSVDIYDAVRLGLTALPNAAAEAAGGLYTRGTGAGQINQPANGRIDANVVAMANDTVTAAAIATGAIDADAIAADAITAAKIATDAITAAKIAADAIGSSELATTAVTEIVNAITGADTTGIPLPNTLMELWKNTHTDADNTVTMIGSFAGLVGADDDTIYGWLRAMMRKDLGAFTLPSGIGGTYNNVTDSLESAQEALSVVDDYIDTEVAAIKTSTDNLATAMELDGAVYRFTTNALELAPSGGGGGGNVID